MEQNNESSTELTPINATPRNRANLRRLKTNSIQSFQRWEKENELLYAMIEDESSWLSALFPNEFITAELFFYALEDGTILCLLANYIQDMAEQYSHKTSKRIPGKKFTFHKSKKGIRESKLFHSRDNVEKFLSWCRLHDIPEAILFESNDVVLVDECRTGGREIVICLMEIARRCTGYEIHQLPQLIKLEREIDEEELNDTGHSTAVGQPLETNSNESREDRSPIDSDSGVESVFDEGIETTIPQLFTDNQHAQDNDANNIKAKQKDTAKHQAPSSLLESSYPKTELDEKVCKIAKDYNIKLVHRLKEGKYIILGKTMFVRMLNDYLLVRIGGGWDTLEHYVMTHSPKSTAGDSSNPTTLPSKPHSRKGSGVWSKLVEKVKKRDSQPNIAVSPVVITKTPRPDSSPASYRLRDRFKKKLSVEEKDGKDISNAIQKIESSLSQTANSSSSPSFTAKTFFQIKSRFDRGRKNSRDNLPDKKRKRMEEVNAGLNGGIKEKEEQEGGENVQDVLMSGNGETTTATTTLIDFQENTFASSFNSSNAPLEDDFQPNLTADDLLFGDGQPSEQSNVSQSSDISSDAESQILFPSTVLEPEQSETMTFSTHEEENSSEVSKEEVTEGVFPVESTETKPQPLGSADDHQLILSQHYALMETQPEEPQMPDISMDNVDGQTTDDLEEPQTQETAVGEVECRANMETQPEAQEEPQISDLAREDDESVEHTNEHSKDQFEHQSTAPEEPQTYDTGMDNTVSVFKDDLEQTADQVEPAAQEESESPEALMDNVENVYNKPDEHFTKLVESQPPSLDDPQTQDVSINNVEDVYRAAEQLTEQVEHPPAAHEEPQTQDVGMDNVESVYKADEHSTELTESQPPALDEPQTHDVSIVEDVYRADEQLTDQVEHQLAAHEEPQTPEIPMLNVELQPTIPVENGFTEVMKPNEPKQQTVESTVLSPNQQANESPEVDKEPSDIAPQAVAVEAAPAHSKPVESTAPQSAIPKHDKADTKTKTSKTTSATMKQTKPQSAARPQSSRTSKVKPSATSSPASATTKKPSSAKSHQLSTTTSKAASAKPQGASKPTSTSTKQHGTTKKPSAETGTKLATTSNKSTTATSKSAATSSKPAAPSSRPAASSSRPATSSSKPSSTSSRPATSTRPGVTKDKKPTRPPSAPIANTKTTVSKTRPQSAKPYPAKPADKTDGKVSNSLGKASGKTSASGPSKTTVKQTTTVTTSTRGPKTTTKTTRSATSKTTKTPAHQQSKVPYKPGSATGAKPKASGASARPKSTTKQPSKKTTTIKTEKPVEAAEPLSNVTDNSAPQEVTTESDVTTTVTESTYTEDGDVTTVRKVTETVTTNGEQQLITTVVEKSE